MSRFLLPYKFKRLGVIMFPIGFLGFYLGHSVDIYKSLHFLKMPMPWSAIFLTACFFIGLSGLYFLVFSKEKQEDEYIKKLKLESFQFAFMIQFFFLLISFLLMLVTNKEPARDWGWIVFLLKAIAIVWLAYIIRYNFILLYNKFRLRNEK